MADTTALRAAYSSAARCFLTSDNVGALEHVDRALALLPPPAIAGDVVTWQRRLLNGEAGEADEADEWRRKLAILLVTVLATALSLARRPQHRSVEAFAGLEADAAASRLFGLAGSLFDPEAPAPSAELPMPGVTASRTPPSVAVALVLGALKLESPRVALSMCEAWLGSVPESIELLLEATGDQAPAPEPAAAADGSTAFALSDSFVVPRSASGVVAARNTPAETLLASYERLLDLYALHVLPRLDRWAEADEWIRLLGRDNGGIVRQAKVEVRWPSPPCSMPWPRLSRQG